jgi:hypothetical protein
MATALNGRARLIPLVQRISFSSRLTFGGTVAATVWPVSVNSCRPKYTDGSRLTCEGSDVVFVKAMQPNIKAMSGRLIAATKDDAAN